MKRNFKINADALGIAASIGCAVHCAFLPIFLTSLPVFGVDIIENRRVEIFMVALAFSIGAYSLLKGRKKHHDSNAPVIIFTVGFLFLILKLCFPVYEKWLLAPAVAGIVLAHVFNFRACKVHNRRQAEPYIP